MSDILALFGNAQAAATDFTKRDLFSKTNAPAKGIIYIDSITKGRLNAIKVNDLAYNGSIYVTCYNGNVYSTPDLLVWTVRTPAGFSNSNMVNVTYNATLSLFMLVGVYSAAITSWTCSDGVTWVKKATIPAITTANQVFSGLGYFMVHEDTTGYVYRTTDGTTWTLATTLAPGFKFVQPVEINGMLFLKGKGTSTMLTYHNYYMSGTTWAQFGGNFGEDIYAIIYYGGVYYYFHVSGTIYQGATLATAREHYRDIVIPNEVKSSDLTQCTGALSSGAYAFEFGNKVMILPVYSGAYIPTRSIITDINAEHIIPGTPTMATLLGTCGQVKQIIGGKVIWQHMAQGYVYIFDNLKEYISI